MPAPDPHSPPFDVSNGAATLRVVEREGVARGGGGGAVAGGGGGGGGGKERFSHSGSIITWQTVGGTVRGTESVGVGAEESKGGRGGGGGNVSPALNGVSALRDRKARG